MGFVVSRNYFGAEGMPAPEALPPGYSNTKELGRLIYTDYVYAFEIAAVILLVAIVAAIALTLRRRKVTRNVDPGVQVKVRREDRVRIVSMPPSGAEQSGTEGKQA
jgi:NADH-quinone oxidoreductase subunit J